MIKQPKFKTSDPKNKEEKLIIELINSLDDVTFAFIRTNYTGNVCHEQFVILRDSAIGYAGAMVRDLTKLLADKSQVKPFLQEAKNIYLAYMDDLEKKYGQ